MISTCIGGDFRQFEERRHAVRGRFGLRRRAGGAEVRIRFGRGWREVRRVVEAGKPGGRFLVGSSAMPLSIPERNIRAMIETARECGRWEATP